MFISDDFDDRTVILYEKYLGIKMCQIGNFHKAQDLNADTHTYTGEKE